MVREDLMFLAADAERGNDSRAQNIQEHLHAWTYEHENPSRSRLDYWT